jgi:hypothetical protein
VTDPQNVRALAAAAGYRLVKGQGKVVGAHDWGRYGLENARTGHKAFGFGNRGVTATLGEVERFLQGGDAAVFEASLRSAKRRG